ncbi:Uncharacterised protein [Candidatus Burarchaeum australiense]|nr:Uncharacterised protein [Candidatus Burarchaeum australiense]
MMTTTPGTVLRYGSGCFRAVENSNHGKGGITPLEAMMTYGRNLPTLLEAHLFSVAWRGANYAAARDFGYIITRTQTAFSRDPLVDVPLMTDGGMQYLVYSSAGLELRFPIFPAVLKAQGITQNDGNLFFAVDNGNSLRQDGPHRYTTVIDDPAQVRVGRLPKDEQYGGGLLEFGPGEKSTEEFVISGVSANVDKVRISWASANQEHHGSTPAVELLKYLNLRFSVLIYEPSEEVAAKK